MSNISSVRLPNGTTYNIKDNTAVKTVELTQAEYDVLSQAEKENGDMYLISDGEPEYTIINDSVPIGAIQAYGGITLPYGWLFCDGTAISRESYSELFSVIGTTYGEGDGSTTFNLPDLRGRTLVGVGNSGATGATDHALGQRAGEETHILTVDEIPSHTHGSAVGGQPANSGAGRLVMQSDGNLVIYGTTGGVLWSSGSNGSISTGAGQVELNGINKTTNSRGGDQAHNIMQPYTVTNYIIKARNTISPSILEELDPQSILFDMLYPVGAYFETSDATFDPNVRWRGTWVLDASTVRQEIKTVIKPINKTPSDSASTNGYFAYLGVSSNWSIDADMILDIGMGSYSGAWRILNFYRYANDWVVISNSNAIISGNVYIKYIEETTQYRWHRTA